MPYDWIIFLLKTGSIQPCREQIGADLLSGADQSFGSGLKNAWWWMHYMVTVASSTPGAFQNQPNSLRSNLLPMFERNNKNSPVRWLDVEFLEPHICPAGAYFITRKRSKTLQRPGFLHKIKRRRGESHSAEQEPTNTMESLIYRRNSVYTSLATSIASPQRTHTTSGSKSDCESDEMAATHQTNIRTRPQSLSCPEPSPHSIQHQRRPPTLDEVLSDRAAPPYTRGAFTAFLSQNHCLESLEFYIDAKRYNHDYYTVAKQLGESAMEAQCPQTEHLCQLWQRLLTVYIYPASPREINVTGEVRDELLRYSHATIPPHPKILDSAVKRIHELMEESIFIPFVNSFASSQCRQLKRNDDSAERSHSTHLSLRRRFSAQPSLIAHTQNPSSLTLDPNFSLSCPNSSSALFKSTSPNCALYSPPSSDPNSLPEESSTDTASPSSPASTEPMTPPTTPPSNEWQFPFPSNSNMTCPRHKENAWKKMSLRLGFKKKSSGTPVSPKEAQLSPQFYTD